MQSSPFLAFSIFLFLSLAMATIIVSPFFTPPIASFTRSANLLSLFFFSLLSYCLTARPWFFFIVAIRGQLSDYYRWVSRPFLPRSFPLVSLGVTAFPSKSLYRRFKILLRWSPVHSPWPFLALQLRKAATPSWNRMRNPILVLPRFLSTFTAACRHSVFCRITFELCL